MTKKMHMALFCAVAIIGLLISPVTAVEAPGEPLYRLFDYAQDHPDIDGDMIVWEDDRNGEKDIYFGTIDAFRASSGYTGVRITTDPASQERPSISGDYIAWQDDRNGNWDIYLYQRSTKTTTQLTNDTGKQWLPIVRGNHIAWYDDSSNRTNIVLYDIDAGEVKDVIDADAKTTIPYGTTEFKPALSEKYVAWVEEGDWRVYYYDIAAGTTEGLVSTSTAMQSWPSLSGSAIAWEDYRHGGFGGEIYMTDLENPSGEQRITNATGDQVSPALSGSIIAWEDMRDGNRSIYMYDLSADEEMSVFLSPDRNDEQLYPAVSGNTIVWQRGASPNSNLYIFVYEPGAPVEPTVTTIEVEPATATVMTNGTQQFTATVLDQNGDVMTDVNVTWTSTDPDVGTIDDDGLFTALTEGTTAVTAEAENVTGEADVNVSDEEPAEPVATRIDVEPLAPTVAVDETVNFSATVYDQFDDEMPDVEVNWTSSNTTVGTIDEDGIFTALTEGTTTVTAEAENVTGEADVNVSSEEPVVTDITVAPATATLAINETETFTATVLDQNGRTMADVAVNWTSTNPDVGTIDADGTFTALTEGTTTVTATAANVTGAADIIVNGDEPAEPVATRIEISPLFITVAVDETMNFSATVYDQFDEELSEAAVNWTSSNDTVGTIDANGTFTAVAGGTTTVTATAGNASASAFVTITDDEPVEPVLDSLRITPSGATLAIGDDQRFVVTARDQDGNTMTNISVDWTSSDETVGTIDETGVFAALAEGTANVTAETENITATATVTVAAAESAPARIAVSPSAITLNANDTFTFSADAFDQSGSAMTDVEVNWTSSDEGVGTIDADGLFTARAGGTTTVTATAENVTGEATVTVNGEEPALASIAVTPSAITLGSGETEQFTATARDQFGDELPDIEFTWTSSDEAVGTIDETGLFIALADGTTTITAEAEGMTGAAEVTVGTQSSGVVVSPAAIALDAGDSRQFTAVLYDPEGNVTPGAVEAWESSDETVGIIDTNGLFTALEEGTTTITATVENETGTATVTVRSTSPAPARIQVSPSEVTTGSNLTFAAMVFDQYGDEMTGIEVVWGSSDETVGTIDADGLFTALADGTVTLTAEAGEISGSALVTVASSPVATRIEIEPATATILPGETQAFTATVFDQRDSEMEWIRVIWSSSNPDVGTIDRAGLFGAFAEGSTEITASAGEAAETAAVAVSTTAVPEPTPTNPGSGGGSVAYSDGGGGSSEPTFCARTCENLASGQTFTFSDLTTSSVGSVNITAAGNIPQMMLTVKKTNAPSAAEPPADDVYEYVEIASSWVNPSLIGNATVFFSVPTDWLEAHNVTPENVRLMRYVNGAWESLETEVVGEENGLYRFRAITPGFSTFAIAASPSSLTASAEEIDVTPEGTGTPEVTETVTTEPTTAVPATTSAPLVYAPFLAPLAFLLWARKNH